MRQKTTLHLRQPTLSLTHLGESKVVNRPVVGVKVAQQGHRDVLLYFDNETRLLVKRSTRFGRTGCVDVTGLAGADAHANARSA